MKTSILFLSAGIWLAGVITGREVVTGIALALLLVAVLLALWGRR